MALSEGNKVEERGTTLQGHCGAAFQVAHRIAPFMQLQVSLQRPAPAHLVIVAPDEVAAITVKLFDQKLLAHVDILYVRETVFGVLDGAPLMDCTHPCLVALAAA